MKQRYLVVYEHGRRNFSGFVPDVPGCISAGKTLAEMRRMMREALEAHLQWMANDGDPIPSPTAMNVEFSAEDVIVGDPDHYFVVAFLEVRTPIEQTLSRALTA